MDVLYSEVSTACHIALNLTFAHVPLWCIMLQSSLFLLHSVAITSTCLPLYCYSFSTEILCYMLDPSRSDVDLYSV